MISTSNQAQTQFFVADQQSVGGTLEPVLPARYLAFNWFQKRNWNQFDERDKE